MKNRNGFPLADYAKQSQNVIEKVRNFLENIKYPRVDELPNDIYDDKKPISLVFAGQYSAGKSTIIKALTKDENIDTGVGITTQETHSYDWNGLYIVDTPGIGTGLRPEHDKIAYKAIANSDILVYVVTHDLFSDATGKNFRDLLDEGNKGSDMLLVINRMAEIGNTEENREVKREDLERVTRPYKLKDEKTYISEESDDPILRCVFIDAESYLKSLKQTDEGRIKIYEKRSNFHALEKALNEIVKEREISARLTSPLHRTIDVVRDAIQAQHSSTGSGAVDEYEEEVLKEEKDIYLKAERDLEAGVKPLIDEAYIKIRRVGIELSNSITGCKDKDETAIAMKEKQSKAEKLYSYYEDRITDEINRISEKYNNKLTEYWESDNYRNSMDQIITEIKDGATGKPSAASGLFAKLSKQGTVGSLGSLITKLTIKEGGKTTSKYIQSNAGRLLRTGATISGKSLPTGTLVKWVKKGSNLGKKLEKLGPCLEAIFAVVGRAIDWYKDKKEREFLQEVRGSFANYASCFEEDQRRKLDEVKRECISKVSELNSQIDEINKLRAKNNETCRKLEVLQRECSSLIENIHRNYKSA